MAKIKQIAFNAQESLLDKDNNIRHSHLVLPILLFADASKIGLTQISAPACGISASSLAFEKFKEQGLNISAEPLQIDSSLEDHASLLLVDSRENVAKLAEHAGVRLLSVVKESETCKAYLHRLVETLGLDTYSRAFLQDPEKYSADSPKKKASAILYLIATTTPAENEKDFAKILALLKKEDTKTTDLVRRFLVEMKQNLPSAAVKNPDSLQRYQQKASFIRHKNHAMVLHSARNASQKSQPLYFHGVRYLLNSYRILDQQVEKMYHGLKTRRAVKNFLKSHGPSIGFTLTMVRENFLDSDPSNFTTPEILTQQYQLAHHLRDTLYSIKERMESDLIVPFELKTQTYSDGYRVLNLKSTHANRTLAHYFLCVQQTINELTSKWINNPFLTPSVQQYRETAPKVKASPQCKSDQHRRRNALQKATFSLLSKSPLLDIS